MWKISRFCPLSNNAQERIQGRPDTGRLFLQVGKRGFVMTISVFHKPDLLETCLKLKAEAGADGVLLAGGTDVLVHMHEGKLHGFEIIDLSGVDELKRIEMHDNTVSVGACATFTEIVRSPVLNGFHGLIEACRSVGSPQIRNAGTIGGNLANGSPAADSAPALLALEAAAVIRKVGSERRIPLSEFYAGKGSTVLQEDEILTAIEFPVMPANAVSAFEKLGLRNSLAISRISLALYLEIENRRITRARAASGSIGLCPMRETKLEEFLEGKPLGGNWIYDGMELLSEEVSQRLKGRATMPYKRIAVTGVFENAARKALGLTAGV